MRLPLAVALFAVFAVTLWKTGDPLPASQNFEIAVYDRDPAHIWNRLYAALLIREDRHGTQYGADLLDPLLWLETEHLLEEPSHRHALQVLDEFLQTHAENLIRDPVKRALLQHDLWAVFDWSVQQYPGNKRPRYDKEKRELQVRLAEVLRRLALTPKEIETLPDNYAQAVVSGTFAKEYDPSDRERAFLPPDLLDPRGPWVCIQVSPEATDSGGVAPQHLEAASGRSGFLVFVRLPGGRKATRDYFQVLWNFPQPWVEGPTFATDQAQVNPDLPSFPAGTQVALVRRMTLFDNQGNLVTSPITESVQVRVYYAITTTAERFSAGSVAEVAKNSGQDFYEVRLRRPLLFANKEGGLRAVGRDEMELSTFAQMGDDLIEEISRGPELKKTVRPVLQTCLWCHSGGGVRSLNSRSSLLKPNRLQKEPRDVAYGPLYWNDGAAVGWKQNHSDWGLLNGYWRASSNSH
ncbi:MAG: hypothetical protein LAO24_21675 [Acidobacteriia bacterium]|nr:hypothetical protein [Terriglobia bacterium]